jgi:hypothetical protein
MILATTIQEATTVGVAAKAAAAAMATTKTAMGS